MKRKLCSYDIAEVPDDCYVVVDSEGEVYFCNARCLGIWALVRATKSGLVEADARKACTLKRPQGKALEFESIKELARWAAANALA